MQKKLVVYIFIFFLSASVFASLFPYPIFSPYTNVTKSNMFEISNFKETEVNSQTESGIKTLLVDWNIADALIEQEKIYRLIDLHSGESILIERIGGVEHADIETINEENTKTLFAITGENWSWERRPVYMQLSDNVYLSASMSAYPHGDSKLNSNLDGHICLHFLNSKTHGSKKVDSAHQKAIKEAQKNSSKLEELI